MDSASVQDLQIPLFTESSNTHMCPRRSGKTYALAGIAMSWALQGKKVCVVFNNYTSSTNFSKLLEVMVHGHVLETKIDLCLVNHYKGAYDLTLIDNIDTLINWAPILEKAKGKILCTTSLRGSSDRFSYYEEING